MGSCGGRWNCARARGSFQADQHFSVLTGSSEGKECMCHAKCTAQLYGSNLATAHLQPIDKVSVGGPEEDDLELADWVRPDRALNGGIIHHIPALCIIKTLVTRLETRCKRPRQQGVRAPTSHA